MECPVCQNELPFRECPECTEKTPVIGKFCCHCGTSLPDEPTEDLNGGPDDFSSRILCSDGSCIGVINEQGICNECGKAYEGNGQTD